MSDPTNNVEAPVSGEPKPTPANAAPSPMETITTDREIELEKKLKDLESKLDALAAENRKLAIRALGDVDGQQIDPESQLDDMIIDIIKNRGFVHHGR